jgi:tetrapyrrole (corrin/porphyrin) methylase-like protein
MLTIVGAGYRIAGQITAEALKCIRSADKVLYLVADPITAAWLGSENPSAESLDSCYEVGRNRAESYEQMVERILAEARPGSDVCIVFYGHPGVLCDPGHEAIRRARQEGIAAVMLPGISALDCLVADLEIDPAAGMQIYEAADFVQKPPNYDPRCMLVLWQAGAIGVGDFKRRKLWSRSGLQRLVDALRPHYPRAHQVVIYEAGHFPTTPPVFLRVPIERLARSSVTIASTLYVPSK